MLNRRDIIVTAAATATAAAASATPAQAAPSREVPLDWKNPTPEQKRLLRIRFDTLDAESHQDFVVGFKNFMGRRTGAPETVRTNEAFLRSKGLNTLDDTGMSHLECFETMMEEPGYAARLRMDTTGQHIMWDRARRYFARDAEKYLTLLDEADDKGPGKLELDPNLVYPDYACHEIHTQPGGFVGNALAGWIFHYAVTQGFRQGSAFHDENHMEYVMAQRKPADGIVNRAVDLGCCTGQSTTPIKMRFPDAEVWGVEVGAPLIRYAHYRARKMGMDVNFRHALAEDTKFPDGYFDMVASAIMFHEVSAEAAKKVVAEIYRILRPGGTYSHSDVVTEGHDTGRGPGHNVIGKANLMKTKRHISYEPWYIEYASTDFPGLLRSVGFHVDLSGDPVIGRPRVIATKPA